MRARAEVVGNPVGGAGDGGRVGLLGRDEQAHAGEGATDAGVAHEGRERHGEDEADECGAHPGEQAPGDRAGDDGEDDAEEHVAAMEAPEDRPGHAVAVARLGVPAAVAAGDDLDDRARLHEHHDRRDEGGEQDLDEEAGDGGEADARALGGAEEGGGAEELRQVEHEHAEPEEHHRALGVDARPVGEEREAVEEVVGRHEGGVEGERHAGEEEEQPERRGEVGHHPHEEMEPAQRVEAGGAQQPGMLEIALAPAAVARGELEKVGRRVLVAAGEVVGHAHGVAAAADEGGLDEVVAEDEAAEGGLAGKLGQAGVIGEGLGPDQGVVAPVVAGVAEPGAQAAGQRRAVDPGGELLDAAEGGDAADEPGRGLQDAEGLVRLHAAGELDDGVGLHQAVGVEAEHERIGAAPARHPVLDVAGLAAEVARAVAVEQAVADDRVGAGGIDEGLLLEPDLGVGGVGEEEEVEGLALAVGVDVVEHRDRRAEDARGILVVGRHQQGGAGLQRPRRAFGGAPGRGGSPSAARSRRRRSR